MERQKAEQEKSLVEIKMEMDASDQQSIGSSPHRRHCFNCLAALVALMGATILCFIIYFFMFAPSCKQDAPSLKENEKVKTLKVIESAEKGRYEVFTAKKAGTYLIYGWMNLTNNNGNKVFLKYTCNLQTMDLEEKAGTEVFLFQKVQMVDKSIISVYTDAPCIDNFFHIYEV